MSELLIFETESLRQQFQLAFPRALPEAMTADELVAREIGVPRPARVEWWETLPAAERQTITLLRRAMVLNHDDAEFAFAALPQTPRNQDLLNLVHRYLDSPTADDATARYWHAIEAIKSFQIDAPATKVVFIKAAETAPLFAELAQAYRGSPSAETVELLESWQWRADSTPLETRSRPLVLLQGTTPALLESLAAHAAHAFQRGRAVRIAFAGEERERAFLEAYLAHRRVPVRSLLPQAVSTPSAQDPFRALVTALRQDASQDLKTRLKFLALLNGDAGNRRHLADAAALQSYLLRFAKAKELPPDDLAYLQKLSAAPPVPAPPPAALVDKAVLLLPFHPLPADRGSVTLSYAGRDVRGESEQNSLFAESETEALHRAGFAYPRVSETRARFREGLAALAERGQGSRFLFSQLSETALPFPARRWNVRREATAAPVEAPIAIADLPAKTLSATQLDLYAACPAAYFFSYRLKWRRFESGEDVYALLFGQAVHATLERYFQQPERRPENLPAIFANALHDLQPGLEADLPLVTTLRAHFDRLAKRLPEIEQQLVAVEGKAVPRHFERQFELQLADVKLVGKIDRVDERGDGSWVVLDYKTGAVDFTPDHVARGLSFQALVYLLAAEAMTQAPCAGVLFYDLKRGEVRRGMLREDLLGAEAKKQLTRGHVMPAEKFARLKAEGLARLQDLAAGIAAGQYPATPDAERCGRCDYALYCRRSAAHE